jgi:hypothetical protein
MKTATVTLRHKKKGRILKVDQSEYAHDLGKHKYRNYELVGERHNDDPDAKLDLDPPGNEPEQEVESTEEAEPAVLQTEDTGEPEEEKTTVTTKKKTTKKASRK